LSCTGLIASKISIIEQLAYKNTALNIILLETQCANADNLVIPNFSLPGSFLNTKNGFVTFVREQLELTLVDQSPEQSHVKGYKITNVH